MNGNKTITLKLAAELGEATVTIDATDRVVLVEEHRDDGTRYLSGWPSIPAALHYHDGQEHAETFGVLAIVNVEDGTEVPEGEWERNYTNDDDALDAINRILSSPDWSQSFLEDIAEIVRRTGRADVEGVQHERH